MRPAVAAALAALVIVPAGLGKEPVAASVCGASGCVTMDDPPRAVTGWGPDVADSPPPLGPFYRVELRMSEHADAWPMWYVPGGPRSVATVGEAGRMSFAQLDGDAEAAFARLTRGVEPFGAPIVVQALVDGEPAADPASYLRLAGRPNELDEPPLAGDWVTIELHTDVESPWTGGPALLLSPSTGILQHGFAFSRVDRAVVERILARRSLESDEPPSGLPWPIDEARVPALVGVVVVGLLGATLIGAWRRRRALDAV